MKKHNFFPMYDLLCNIRPKERGKKLLSLEDFFSSDKSLASKRLNVESLCCLDHECPSFCQP